MTAAEVMDVKARLHACARQAANAISAYTQVIMEDDPKNCSQFQSQSVQTTSTTTQKPKSRTSSGSSRTKFCTDVHSLDTSVGQTTRSCSVGTGIGKKVPNWACQFLHRKRGLFLSAYVDDVMMAGRKRNIAPMWCTLWLVLGLGGAPAMLARSARVCLCFCGVWPCCVCLLVCLHVAPLAPVFCERARCMIFLPLLVYESRHPVARNRDWTRLCKGTQTCGCCCALNWPQGLKN